MQTEVTRLKSYLIQVNVKESGVELEKAKKQVIERIRNEGRVKGFKKGSAIPDAVIVREYGEEFISNQALDVILDKIYPKILKKENIIPVAAGKVTEVKSLNPVEFIIEIEVLPEIEIDEKKVKKVSLKKTEVTTNDDEVDTEIKAIEKRFTHFHEAGSHTEDGADTSNTTIENGDRVTIDAQWYEKKGGEAIAETRVPGYPLVIGSNTFIPGFEAELIGSKAGDEVAFDITFPSDYHSEIFKNKKVHFIVKIEKLEKPHTPEWNEKFIEGLRGVKTDFNGFKELLKKEIQERKEYDARSKDEHELLTKILEIVDFEVGEHLLSHETDRVLAEHKQNLEGQGFTLKDYLSHLKKSEESYKDEVVKPEALRRLKAELILRKLREVMNIEATDAEVAEEISKVIAQYTSEDVKKRLTEKLIPGDSYYEEIKSRLAYKKVVDSFFA